MFRSIEVPECTADEGETRSLSSSLHEGAYTGRQRVREISAPDDDVRDDAAVQSPDDAPDSESELEPARTSDSVARRPSIETLRQLGETSRSRVLRSGGNATGPLAAVSVEKDEVEGTVPGLEDHLLVVTLAGHQRGSATADGQLNGPDVSNRAGSLSFLPRERTVTLDLHGLSRHVDVLIGRRAMERAAAELLRGDPARLELAGFSSLLDPVVERLALRIAARLYLRPRGSTTLDDALVQALCIEIVSGYAQTPRRRTADRLPRLVGLRLMAVLDQLEHGSIEQRRPQALARTAELRPRAFMDAFEVETGMTLRAYLDEQRIERLRALLDAMPVNEPLDLDALAAQLDYDGADALERACVAAFGLAPAAYLAARDLVRGHDDV